MTDEKTPENEALQAVVDRVNSYQESAPEGTVEAELKSALHDAGIDLPDDHVTALAEAIEAGDGDVDVTEVVG